jgi:hypothetical protein
LGQLLPLADFSQIHRADPKLELSPSEITECPAIAFPCGQKEIDWQRNLAHELLAKPA